MMWRHNIYNGANWLTRNWVLVFSTITPFSTMADISHVTKQVKVDKLYNMTSLPGVENLFQLQKVYFVTLSLRIVTKLW